MIIDKTLEKVNEVKSHIMVGLDTDYTQIPKHILEQFNKPSDAIFYFNKEIIDNTHDLVAIIKINNAFYEMLGSEGYRALEKTVDYAHEKGLIVVSDGKKNDIGNSAKRYALAQFEALKADFITINGYMGPDTVKPFVDQAVESEGGIFLLAKTSNGESGYIQDLFLDEVESKKIIDKYGDQLKHAGINVDSFKPTVYTKMAAMAAEFSKELKGEQLSGIGLVMGATYPEDIIAVRAIHPEGFNLYPGYGVQGAKGEMLINGYNEKGMGGVVNNSRGVILAFSRGVNDKFGIVTDTVGIKDENGTISYNPTQFREAARDSVIVSSTDINKALYEARKLSPTWVSNLEKQLKK